MNIDVLNNLELQNIDDKLFPVINILNYLPSQSSLFETVLVVVNDELVNLFLKNKIRFNDISKNILKIINLKEFQKYKKKNPKNIQEIHILSDYVRLKVNSLCV